MVDKQSILQNIQNNLNHANQPWQIIVQGDSIIASWKWMDATFFSPNDVTNEVREYKFIVTLLDNAKWSEKDISVQSNVNMNGNGLSFGKSAFIGQQSSKSFTIGIGKNNSTGEVGIIKTKFDTSEIKKAIRDYLTNCGWKKKGFFG